MFQLIGSHKKTVESLPISISVCNIIQQLSD